MYGDHVDSKQGQQGGVQETGASIPTLPPNRLPSNEITLVPSNDMIFKMKSAHLLDSTFSKDLYSSCGCPWFSCLQESC